MEENVQVYKGTKLVDKEAILPNQVRKKIELMMVKGDHLSISGASVILAELFGVLLGLRRSETSLRLNASLTEQLYYASETWLEQDGT